MSPGATLWAYRLAPDVEASREGTAAWLRTPVGELRLDGPDGLAALPLLGGAGASEAELAAALRLAAPGNAETRCAALLFRLDRMGLLARGLHSEGRRIASCVPLRKPPSPPGRRPPDQAFRLAPHALARAERSGLALEAAGAWARITIEDRALLPLLYDLAIGKSAAALADACPGHDPNAVQALLTAMDWCGLIDHGDDLDAWPAHELLFHARTRRGYARVRLGKASCEDADRAAELAADPAGRPRLSLAPPNLSELIASDSPHALVSERRRSVRRQGSMPLEAGQLSEFLFRTLRDRDGRRPYPSGGALYPLTAYLAIDRCRNVPRGLYEYDAVAHELIVAAEPGPGFERLLADAAGVAGSGQLPQVLLVLAAQRARIGRIYGDLSYSLVLKEVGAVFQAAMMSASAMELAACPLGCGDSMLFSGLIGGGPAHATSVGEMILGSPDDIGP